MPTASAPAIVACFVAAVSGAHLVTDPVRVPLLVDVGLLGFSGDGAWQLEMDAAELFTLLKTLLPERRPACGPDGEPADVVYEFTYNVVQMRTGLPRLQEKIASALRPAAGGNGLRYEVAVDAVDDFFERTYEAFFTHQDQQDPMREEASPRAPAYTILVVNPNRADIAALLPPGSRPPEGFTYHYAMPGEATPTQMWLSKGRYLVLDLSAGPNPRGMAGATEGAVSAASVPHVHPALQGGAEAEERRAADPRRAAEFALEHTQLLSRLAALMLSAVTHILAPDLRSCSLPEGAAGKLVVPLVVLRNHRRFDPLRPGHAHSLDIGSLKAQLSRMLVPQQSVTLLPSTHDIHGHPQISVALTRATKSVTMHGQVDSYVDAAALEHELRHSVDWLAAGLMHRSEGAGEATADAAAAAADDDSHSGYHLHTGWASNATVGRRQASSGLDSPSTAGGKGAAPSRVLPVFVFSLLGMHPTLLLDRTSLVHASDHAVIVLQTNSTHLPVPFYADQHAAPLTISTLDPTPHALAGLAASIGAVLSPFESFNAHGAPALDFHWAIGQHPFGPFSATPSLPDIVIDVAQRHAVLSQLSAASDLLFDAVAAVEALAARYVHPSETDSPRHREDIEMQHAQSLKDGYEAALLHLAEESKGMRHSARDERRRHRQPLVDASAGGPRVGHLLRRLREGTLSLSSELASTKALHLHGMLQAYEPRLAEAGAALAAGNVEEAHDLAVALLEQAKSVVAHALDQVRGLEAALQCCHVRAARPRAFPVKSVVALILVGSAIWLGVLWLTAPGETRGKAVRIRPGALAMAAWTSALGGGRRWGRGAKEF